MIFLINAGEGQADIITFSHDNSIHPEMQW